MVMVYLSGVRQRLVVGWGPNRNRNRVRSHILSEVAKLQPLGSTERGTVLSSQVFVDNKYIGGCDTILEMQAAGTLLPLLTGEARTER